MKSSMFLLLSAVLLGCGEAAMMPLAHVASDGTALMEGFDPPGPPADAIQLVSPIIHGLQPGDNREYCYYSKVVLDKPQAFRSGQGFQAPGGHHAVIYWTSKPKPEQLKECTEEDMLTLHVLTGGGGENGNGIMNGLPAGTSFHVPAGAQFVANIHALNASPNVIDTQAAINLYYGDPQAAAVSSFYVTGSNFSVPVGQTMTWTTSCVADRPLQIVRAVGHFHEWGTHIQLTRTTPAGVSTIYYDKTGSADFSYNPPLIDYSVDAPLVISPGDTITAACTWANTLSRPLEFPIEMCAASGYILGDQPEAGCVDGVWNK